MTQDRTRLFTNEYDTGDVVKIIAHRHGWEDGRIQGTIIRIGTHHCVVRADDGAEYEIRKPKDIRLVERAGRSPRKRRGM